MKPCPRVGVEVTWKCNATCKQCFYLRNPDFHTNKDIPIEQVKAEILRAKANGLNHVNYVGYGEPSLCSYVVELTKWCTDNGMASSMITNGLGSLAVYNDLIAAGMDHFHISSHGTHQVLNAVFDHNGAFEKQMMLKQNLRAGGIPFRTNFTLQRENYENLLKTVDYEISMGAYHFVFLGFLPHYEWDMHVDEVAVHPGALRPLIEEGAESLLLAETLFTIRYQPFCHLNSKYWPYVTNARHVLYDPWEWNYTLRMDDISAEAKQLGDSVACDTPCNECLARHHCGGWNKKYADAFGGADLKPITEVPAEYAAVWDNEGGVFDLNPANELTGTIR